ncbi:bifunctional metallophosphatase/5'-nucleotidase [Exilibacterium tricleocarpae]|uniref:Bifunctional metallophosphatase/5'-nucleotidase n=1 Tax=Exilibacterium tricleocarpae TaxID=2591008 RepID=A0A545ST64_9GAMM|nr:5'-nucleotidase C-terminal domain-containing protein [Exilibacterium tricleocarpae]TQV68160.1 bifunctional metallophosphatase/5'-nucleotidase [Exilibacterium tricleocarpae]
MNKWKLAALAASTSLVLAGCDLDGDDGDDGFSSLVNQTAVAAGDNNCPFGGVRIDSGVDTDRSGTLEAAEITETEFVCTTGSFELQLLHFADVDGGRGIINNATRFSAIVDKFRDQYDNTLLLSSGDNWIPGPEYNVASDAALADVLGVTGTGRAHVAYLNALGVQAAALGNHEFDLGTEAVAGVLAAETNDGQLWPGTQFPYLSANLDFSTDPELAGLIGTDGAANTALANQLAASTVIHVNGQRIGVVGATTPTLDNISSPGDITIAPADAGDIEALAAQIQADVDALTARGIDKIILLAHMQQLTVELVLATLLRDVDIIVAGGSNTILADGNDRLRDGDTAAAEYPVQLASAAGEPVLVVNTDGDYTYLGRLVVNFDTRGVLITSLLDDSVNGAYATDEMGLVENGLAISDAIDEVAAISDALNGALASRAGNVLGLTSVYLNGERGSVRTEETNLGNLSAQANLEYAQDTDSSAAISIKNGGGIRAPIGFCSIPPGATGEDALECNPPAGIPGINNPGEISQLDLEIALSFNNSLSLVTLTGAQLKEILEHGVAATAAGATPGQFPQVAGIRFSFDPSRTAQTVDDSVRPPVVASAGSRIRNLVVLDDNGADAGGSEVVVVQDGVLNPAAAAQTFRVVTLGFIAGGGDRYPFPADAGANVVDLRQSGVQTGFATFADDGTEQDALAEYLNANFPADADAGTPAYDEADTEAEDDRIIQNLSVVAADTVLD